MVRKANDAKEKAPAGRAGAGADRADQAAVSYPPIIAEKADKHKQLEAIPKELKSRPQWVVHKNKAPYNPRTGYGAKAGDKSTWADYQTAVKVLTEQPDKYDGIGFEFDNNGLVGIDLDTVRDPASGFVAKEALEIIGRLASYTELSPSGYGFHIIANADVALSWNKAPLPDNGIERPDIDLKTGEQRINKKTGELLNKKPEIEMYTTGRYFTVTGNVYDGAGLICDRKKEVAELHRLYAPRKAKATQPTGSRNSDPVKSNRDYLRIGLQKDSRFRDMWEGSRMIGDESADDLALMNKLAFWCNCDLEVMVEAFKESPYVQQKDPKHAKKADREDYLQRTAKRAAVDCAQTAQEKDVQYRFRQGKQISIKKAEKYMQIFEPSELVPELLDYDLNDIGNAQRFLHFYASMVRYNKEANAWYIWNGKKWEHDLTGKIYRLGIHAVKTYKLTAQDHYLQMVEAFKAFEANPPLYREEHDGEDPADPKTFKAVLAHSVTSGTHSRISSMVDTSGHAAYILQDDLDQHKNLLTCTNGTVDLCSSSLQTHNTAHFITKMVEEDYRPGTAAPTFMSFLDRIFRGDADLIGYVQKVMGYCITGETREQCFFIGYGTGANGKSTLIDAVSDVMAEHTQTIPTGVLMDKEKESGATPELARAKGARLVIASESKDINTLNEAQIKQLTGGDIISARPLYSQGFEFKPMFKIWLSTNHKPNIKGTDNGIWRRVHLIPFAVTIPEAEQDPQLPQKLRTERAGILAWLIEGARRYYAEGLKKPDAVKAATEDYRTEMDVLGGFLADCTEEKAGAFTRSTTLYSAYQGWCNANGIDCMKQNAFSRRLTDRGMTAKRTAVARGYMDIALTEAGEDFTKPQDFVPVHLTEPVFQ